MDLQIQDSIGRTDVEALRQYSGPELLTLTLPTEKAGRETRQNPIRYKNLATKLSELLRDPQRRDALYQLEHDHEFWQHAGSGLALYSSPDRILLYRLPITLPEYSFVGKSFHLRPILPYLQDNGSFFLLEVNLNRMSLLLGSHYGELSTIPLPEELPLSFAVYLQRFEAEDQIQHYSVAGQRGDGMLHGHGDVNLPEKIYLQRFFRRFAEQVEPILKEQELPLVISGVEYLLPIYRESNTYTRLMKEDIPRQPTSQSEEQRRELAWKVVEPWYQVSQQTAREKWQQVQGSKLAAQFISDIIPLAAAGQVESLFVKQSASAWGKYQPEQADVNLHTEQQPGSEQLWEVAIQHTLRTNGQVYILTDDDGLLPDREGGAVLRY